MARYPHATPWLECGANGKIHEFSPNLTQKQKGKESAKVSGVLDTKARISTSTDEQQPRQFLPSPERNQLHIEIYEYFSWLRTKLLDLLTNEAEEDEIKDERVSSGKRKRNNQVQNQWLKIVDVYELQKVIEKLEVSGTHALALAMSFFITWY